MGRSHDYYCPDCKVHWSPFDFDRCPGDHAEDDSVYDLNHDFGPCIVCGENWCEDTRCDRCKRNQEEDRLRQEVGQ